MEMYYLALILLILAGSYLFLEPHLLGTEEVKVKLENVEGIKIVHLTDIHSQRFGKTEKKVLAKLEEIDPDYVFVTGDFVDKRTRNLEECQKFWEALAEQHSGKVFGVLGNHEYQHPKTDQIINYLEESGIQLLNNESVELEEFTLGGVKSPHLNHDDLEIIGKPEVLLAHSPEIFKKVKDKEIGLVLSGHTHGGQVNIPLLTRLILPLRYGKKYKEGLFKEENTYMYVSRGVGTTILPIRFNAPPEVSLINIK